MGIPARMRRVLRNALATWLIASDSKTLGKIFLWLSQIRGPHSLPGHSMRRMVDLSQPVNPLEHEGDVPPIDIVTITAADTFEFAEVSLTLAKQNSQNPVRGLFALVPDHLVAEARERIPSAHVVSEKDVLPGEIFTALAHFDEVGRSHWVLCQVLGMYFSVQSDSKGVLVLDADTFILQPRTWLARDGRQTLSFSREYYEPYEEHCLNLYGPRKRHFGLTYITHFMLMQPEIVREIFPSDQSFVSWILAGNPKRSSAVADYHTYGRWLVDHHPELVALARWHNKGFRWEFGDMVDTGDLIIQMKKRHSSFLSVSSHRYLEK